MAQQWFCQVKGKEYGPISAQTLQQWAQEGRLSPDDLVRLDQGQWMSAKSLKGLIWPNVSPPTPPTPPPNEGVSWAPSNQRSDFQSETTTNDSGVEWSPPENMEPLDFAHSSYRTGRKLGKTPKNLFAIFDWKFEYYLTPWIIRIIWVIFVAFTILSLVVMTFGLVSSMLPDTQASSPSPSSPSNWGGGHVSPRESFLPDWLSYRLLKIIVYVFSVAMLIIVVLITRVVLEMMIVLFRIAEDIGVLKRKYAEGK